MSKNTSLIWQISFNGQRCDLQIHHCFLNDRPIACSQYIKNTKKPRSWSFYFLFKIFQTRDIIHSEKSGICSDGNQKQGFACRDGRQMLDAGVHLADKRTLLMKTHIPFQTTVQNILPNPLLLLQMVKKQQILLFLKCFQIYLALSSTARV